MIRYFLIFALVFALLGCINNIDNDDEAVIVDPEFVSDLMSNSYDTLTIDSKRYILEADLWRDFMPPTPEDGRPMVSINWLVNLDSIQVPSNLDMTKQYVILNDSIWISDYSDETRRTYDYKLENISRNGPKWGPNVEVDVISKITDSTTDTVYFIKAENIIIGATF